MAPLASTPQLALRRYRADIQSSPSSSSRPVSTATARPAAPSSKRMPESPKSRIYPHPHPKSLANNNNDPQQNCRNGLIWFMDDILMCTRPSAGRIGAGAGLTDGLTCGLTNRCPLTDWGATP